jgi:hypothetical protein
LHVLFMFTDLHKQTCLGLQAERVADRHEAARLAANSFRTYSFTPI